MFHRHSAREHRDRAPTHAPRSTNQAGARQGALLLLQNGNGQHTHLSPRGALAQPRCTSQSVSGGWLSRLLAASSISFCTCGSAGASDMYGYRCLALGAGKITQGKHTEVSCSRQGRGQREHSWLPNALQSTAKCSPWPGRHSLVQLTTNTWHSTQGNRRGSDSSACVRLPLAAVAVQFSRSAAHELNSFGWNLLSSIGPTLCTRPCKPVAACGA